MVLGAGKGNPSAIPVDMIREKWKASSEKGRYTDKVLWSNQRLQDELEEVVKELEADEAMIAMMGGQALLGLVRGE